MKNFKKQALPAFMMLVLSVLCLTGVTYAWFSTGDSLTVDNIQINVDSASGILFASSATGTYKDTLTFDTDTGVSNITEYIPVSTNGALIATDDTWSTLNFYKGYVDSSNSSKLKKIEAKNNTATESYYLQFDMYIESLDAEKNIYFGDWSLTALTSKTGNAAKAMRIAFVNHGTADTKEDVDKLVDSANYDDYAPSIVIVEPNSTSHISAANLSSTDAGKKQTYYGLKAELNNDAVAANNTTAAQDIKPTSDTSYMSVVTTKDADDYKYVEGSTKTPVFTIGAGYSKITCYVWLEGQDCDCLNAISSDGIKLVMPFVAKKTA